MVAVTADFVFNRWDLEAHCHVHKKPLWALYTASPIHTLANQLPWDAVMFCKIAV
jgi:hypothetical protein